MGASGKIKKIPLHLGFVTARSASFGRHLHMDPGLGRLLDVFAERFEKISVACVSKEHDPLFFTHRVTAENIEQYPFPKIFGVKDGFGAVRDFRRVLNRLEAMTDVSYVQLPFASPLALYGATQPRVYHFCADIREIVEKSNAYDRFQRLAANGLARFIESEYQHLIRHKNARVVANGEAIWRKYNSGAGRSVVSATMYKREVASRPRTRADNSRRDILFVGYLRPEKGIDVLLAAMEKIWRTSPTTRLLIVGSAVSLHEGTHETIVTQVKERMETNQVVFLGHQTFGPALFDCFANADVLILPSRSEGTPRVLNEARAFGCPVIASRVGGIPSLVDHEVDGLLFPSGDDDALVSCINAVFEDQQFRERLISKGLERAKSSCIEDYAEEVIHEICLLANQVGHPMGNMTQA